jgi:vacuolar-type H+-ATPase subunit C/Vma6
MDQSGASVYVYAKASGMMARSFIGKKAHELFDVHSLQDLWTLVFKDEVPLVPEVMLARQIEKTAEERFIADYKMLVSCYDEPADVLVHLLRFYDYRNIKAIGAALCSGDSQIPEISTIGSYSMLNYAAWPSLQKITKGSSISWYNTIPTWENQKELDRRLDLQYTKDLWDSVQLLPASERKSTADFLQQQIVLQNCEWALRLRVYYNMNKEEIISWLVCAEKHAHKNDILAGQAIRSLDLPLDDYNAWHDWKYNSLLNVADSAEWKLDPRWFEQAVNHKLNKIAISKFHEIPFSALVLVSWFKIKQNELNMIRTAAEGLRLNVSDDQLKTFVGV